MPTPDVTATEELARELKQIREHGVVTTAAVQNFQQKLDAQTLAINETRRLAVEGAQSATEREMIREYSEGAVGPLPGQGGQGAVRLVGQEGQRIALVGSTLPDGERVWGLFDDPHARTDWQRKLQQIATKRSIIRYALRRIHGLGRADHVDTPRLDRELVRHLRRGPAEVRALYSDESLKRIFTDTAGTGAEFMPDVVFPELEREARLMPGIAELFPSRAFPANVTNVQIPYEEGIARPYYESLPTVNDPTPANLSDAGTNASTAFGLKGMVVGIQISVHALEDALVTSYDSILRSAAAGIVYGKDDVLVNGDSTATHEDSIALWNPRGLYQSTTGAGGPSDHRRMMKGLRRLAVDGSATRDGGSIQTTAGLATLAGDLHAASFSKLGNPGGGLIFLTSPEVALTKIMLLAEVLTLDKILNPSIMAGLGGFGTTGGLRPGQVGAILGTPIIVSGMITADLAATGLFTNSGSKSAVHCIDTTRFEVWQRDGMSIAVDDDLRANTKTVIARHRFWFRQVGKTSQDAVATSYNWL